MINKTDVFLGDNDLKQSDHLRTLLCLFWGHAELGVKYEESYHVNARTSLCS